MQTEEPELIGKQYWVEAQSESNLQEAPVAEALAAEEELDEVGVPELDEEATEDDEAADDEAADEEEAADDAADDDADAKVHLKGTVGSRGLAAGSGLDMTHLPVSTMSR